VPDSARVTKPEPACDATAVAPVCAIHAPRGPGLEGSVAWMSTLDLAEAALADRDWARVRALLRDLSEHAESDRALEMLATAAWWLDDVDCSIEAREQLFSLRRVRGDRPAAATVAIQLAWDSTIGRRDAAIASGWAERARSLLDGLPPSADDAWLLMREATLTGGGSDVFARARRLAVSVGAFDAEMTAVALEGNALVAEGRVAEGLVMMDGAAAAACAGELEDPLAITFACCQVLGACSRVQDFERAGQWCDRIAVMCDKQNIWTVLAVSRCMYAPVLVARGHYPEAERILETSVRHYRDLLPHHAAEAAVWLADLRIRQGQRAEAVVLLDRAEPDPGCRLVRATLAFDEGADDAAAEHAQTFLRQSSADRFVERLAALDLLVRAQARRGHLEDAASALSAVEQIAAALGSPPAAATVLRGRAALQEVRGEMENARASLEDAADVFERGHAPYEAARARLDLARLLDGLGRPADAVRERARGEQALRELRAARADAGPLTTREREVLALVAQGLSNPEIARRLVLSTHTVHRHVANLMRKLGVSSRIAAVSRGSQLGLI
jgi:DNA-binding CsgD family transcriptional regulator